MSIRKVALISLVLLWANMNLLAQTQPLMVFWDEKKTCGEANIQLDRNLIRCSRKSKDDLEFQTFKHNGLTISSALMILGEWVKAVVSVSNDSSRDIPIDVRTWNASSFRSYESFRSGEKPVKMSRPSPPGKTYSKSPGAVETETVMNPLSKLPSNAPVANVGTTSSTTLPGTTMKQDPPPASPNTPKVLTKKVSGNENESAMNWKTLPVGQEFSGAVSFATVKEAAFRLVAFDINGTVYIFTIGKPTN